MQSAFAVYREYKDPGQCVRVQGSRTVCDENLFIFKMTFKQLK